MVAACMASTDKERRAISRLYMVNPAISSNITGMEPISFDWHFLWLCFGKISLAWALVLPTGWWSEKQGNSVGIRTFPLVAMASCGFLMIMHGDTGDSSRVLQGMVTGI